MATQSIEPNECVSRGVIALVVRFGRLVGVAPVTMTRVDGGWRMAGPLWGIWYFGVFLAIVTGVTHFFAIIALMERQKASGRAQHIQITITIFIFYATHIISNYMLYLFVYKSSVRLTKLIQILRDTEKIRSKPSFHRPQRCREIGSYILVLGYFCYMSRFLQVMIWQLINYVINWENEKDGVVKWLCYGYSILAYVLLNTVIAEFMMVVIYTVSTFQSVNDSFEELVEIFDQRNQDVNILNIVHEHLITLEDFFNLVDLVNETYGHIIFVFIIKTVYALVLSPYHVVLNVFILKRPLGETLIGQGVAMLLMFACMMAIGEPGHRLQDEMERTRIILRQLMSRVSRCDRSVVRELDLLYTLIVTNEATYSACDVIVLSRSFGLAAVAFAAANIIVLFDLVSFTTIMS